MTATAPVPGTYDDPTQPTQPTAAERAASRTPQQQRVHEFVSDVMARVRQAMVDHDMTYPEYDAAKNWLIAVGEAGEWPLFLDVWFESTVEQLDAARHAGSRGTILGPYYLPDQVSLPSPATLPMREDEPGEPLVFRGRVRSVDADPLPGATLDVWHAAADGFYSGFCDHLPAGLLRARVSADTDGRFEIRTVMPAPYQIPTGGPSGRLIAAANWSAWRPAHLHLLVSAPGHRTLTTQLYFTGRQFLDDDVASAVKPELVLDPRPADDGRGWAADYDVVLDRAGA
jgi:catechol 1,2-dioxygenase